MIRIACQAEAVEILREPQIIERIGIQADRMLYQPWVAENDKHKMMFVFWLVDERTAEAHIAAPASSVLSSRSLARELMTWLFNHGIDKIVTNCPEGKISNMARKLGMSWFKTEGDDNYFEVRSWV